MKRWIVVILIAATLAGGAWIAIQDPKPVKEIRQSIRIVRWLHGVRKRLREIKNVILKPQHEAR